MSKLHVIASHPKDWVKICENLSEQQHDSETVSCHKEWVSLHKEYLTDSVLRNNKVLLTRSHNCTDLTD